MEKQGVFTEEQCRSGSTEAPLLYGFPSPVQSAAKQLAGCIGAERDRLVREAINYKIGHSDWRLSEVKERGKFVITPDKKETFVFDGESLIEFVPPEFSRDVTIISGRQKHRLLYV